MEPQAPLGAELLACGLAGRGLGRGVAGGGGGIAVAAAEEAAVVLVVVVVAADAALLVIRSGLNWTWRQIMIRCRLQFGPG